MTCADLTQPDTRPHLIKPKAESYFEIRQQRCLPVLPIMPPWAIGFPSCKRLPLRTRARLPQARARLARRVVTFKGGLEIVEKVVYWNPPYCYAFTSEGKHWPFKNYVGSFSVEPIDDQSGRFIFRE